MSSCSDQETTWEDSQNKGKSMTTVRAALCTILMKTCAYSTFPPEIDPDLEYACSFSLAITPPNNTGREKSVRESGRAGPAVEVSVSP